MMTAGPTAMLHFLSSLFRPASDSGDLLDKALLERAIERAVEGSDPRLRALPGYRKRLREPVERAALHIIGLVNALPEPAEISSQAFRADPRLRAFFVSPEHLQEVIGNCPLVSEYLDRAHPAPDQYIFGLLSMNRTEKNVLGMDLRGDTVQREVAQVAVNFSDHRYLGPSDNETETRHELMRRGFDFLVETALQDIVAARSRKTELDQQRQLLQRKLKAMQAGNWGLQTVFATDSGAGSDPAALEAEIETVESELMALGSPPQALEHSLEQLSATLGDPAHWLDARTIRLTLNQMSIKAGSGAAGSVYELELTELFAPASDRRRIILLGRFPVQELPPRRDFLAQAERLLGH